jgi:hypothetical protein
VHICFLLTGFEACTLNFLLKKIETLFSPCVEHRSKVKHMLQILPLLVGRLFCPPSKFLIIRYCHFFFHCSWFLLDHLTGSLNSCSTSNNQAMTCLQSQTVYIHYTYQLPALKLFTHKQIVPY